MTADELLAHLDHAGLDDIRQVREASIEGDGPITFICEKPT